MRSDFYVYVLLDPRRPGNFQYGKLHFEHEPFYVGKGKGRRDISHSLPCFLKRDRNSRKANKIRKILSTGSSPIIVRVKTKATEQTAFKLEAKAITLIGRGKNGPLVNCTDGGEGTSGYEWSAADKQRIRRQWKAWHASLTEDERELRSQMLSRTITEARQRLPDERKADWGRAISDAAKRRTDDERAELSEKFRQIQHDLPEATQRRKNRKVRKGLKQFYANRPEEHREVVTAKQSSSGKAHWDGLSKEERADRTQAIKEGYAKKPKRELKVKNAKIADTIARQHASASLYDKRMRSFMVMCGVMLRNAVDAGAELDLEAMKKSLRTRAERFYSKAINLDHEPKVLRDKVRALIAA